MWRRAENSMALNLLHSLLAASNRQLLSGVRSMAPRVLTANQDVVNPQANPMLNYVQDRGAARRGKRIERSRQARLNAAKKRLLEAQNPKQKKDLRRSVKVDKTQFRFQNERQLDRTLPNPPADNVYFMDKYRRTRHSFDEIIEFHKQAVHPDVLNKPDALVSATVELNLKMKIKKKKYIEKIESTLCYPNLFKVEVRPRKIVALCKEEADKDAAKEAGAFVVGGLEVVEQLKKNQLTQRDFDHLVCQTSFLVDFAAVKGMKGTGFFPTKTRGNFGDNMGELVTFFKNGTDYSLKKIPDEPEYGFIECHFGRLNMTNEQLRQNLIALFQSINRFKPLNLADNKQFFERVSITTPETAETFFLRFWELIDDYQDPDTIMPEEEEEEKSATA